MSTLRERIEQTGRGDLLSSLRIEDPVSYQDFIDVLYSELDRAVALMEHDAGDHMDMDEDRISRSLCRMLKMKGFQASHEQDQGGHVDLTVTSKNHRYEWLGEAKIWNGPAYIRGGFDQLLNRYSSGTPGRHHGGVLIYIQIDRCSERLKSWREHLAANAADYEDLEFQEDLERPGLSFSTTHVHSRMGSGVPKYQTKHLAISLYRPAGVTPA